ECFGRNLAAFARKADELQSTAVEFRRAAFVRRDMRLGMAQHGAPRRSEMRQCERVGRGSGRHQENCDLMREKFGEARFDASGPGIAGVGRRCALIRTRNGGKNLRLNPGGVVACEVHGLTGAWVPPSWSRAAIMLGGAPAQSRNDRCDVPIARPFPPTTVHL